ncbi:MAG: hypothetical protein CSA36_03965 [Draconibacterium sp.]|nr:MAG: hypothetical protein CSA36_03965 [Draconibacterium sp.]
MEQISQKRNNTKIVFAVGLILIGGFWLLQRLGIYIEFPRIIVEKFVSVFGHFFRKFSHIIFSWPMVLIIIGAVLLAGRRSGGVLFLIVGGVFLLPRIFSLPDITLSLLLPIVLIGIGVAMIAKQI